MIAAVEPQLEVTVGSQRTASERLNQASFKPYLTWWFPSRTAVSRTDKTRAS